MRSTDLTLRKDLNRPIEWDEMDDNLENLDSDSPWLVHNGHISYSGKVSLYGTDAEYDFDFMDGVNNIATLGTQDAELQVHIDGANSFISEFESSNETISFAAPPTLVGDGSPPPMISIILDSTCSAVLRESMVSVQL